MGQQRPVSVDDERTGEWVGEHRNELVDLRPLFRAVVAMDIETEATADDWRRVLPPGVRLIQCLGRRTAHVRISGAEVQDVVIKIDLPRPSGLRWLADRHSPARGRYMWAHRLRALGIDTPRPLGYIEHAKEPARTRSFAASEYIYAPNLIHYRDEKLPAALAGGADAVLENRAVFSSEARGELEVDSAIFLGLDGLRGGPRALGALA